MRFHYGAVPEDSRFLPEPEGWLAIREAGPWKLQLIAMPIGFVLVFLALGLLYLVFPRELVFTRPLTGSSPSISVITWILVGIFILLIPVHELTHVLCQPGWGSSSNSVIGLWLSKAIVYAHYEGAMSRNRFLLVIAMPYMILGLVPIPLVAVSGMVGLSLFTVVALAYVSIIGSALACADAVVFWLVMSQIPSSALVRNKGWKTYWKPGAPDNQNSMPGDAH